MMPRLALPCLALLALGLLQGCLFEPKKGGNPDYRRFYVVTQANTVDLDSSCRVEWVPINGPKGGTVRLDLYLSLSHFLTVADSLPNDGGYTWDLEKTKVASGYLLGASSGFRLRVTSLTDTGAWDYGRYFTIASPHYGNVTLQQPLSGDRVLRDSAFPVRWASTAPPGTDFGVQLHRDSGLLATWTMQARYEFVQPHLDSSLAAGDGYRIRVFNPRNPTIQAFGGPFKILSTYQGGFDFISPKGGENYTAGSSPYLSWTVRDLPGSTVRLDLSCPGNPFSPIAENVPIGTTKFTWTLPNSLASIQGCRLRIRSEQIAALESWSGTFSIIGTKADAFEFDDVLGAAKPIETDGRPQVRSLPQGDLDWIRFQALPGKRYLGTFKNGSNLKIQLLDSAGLPVSSPALNRAYEYWVELVPPRPGTYHLRLLSDIYIPTYEVALSAFDSVSADGPSPFVRPDSATVVQAGSQQTAAWSIDLALQWSWVQLSLWRDSVLIPIYMGSIQNTGTAAWKVPVGLATSDRYRLRLTGAGGAPIAFYSPPFIIQGSTPDSYEPDNLPETARNLPADDKAQERNLTYQDQDWAAFEAKPGFRYLVSAYSSFACSLEVFNSAGTRLFRQGGTKVNLHVTPATPGPYRVRVRAANQADAGAYTLSLFAYEGNQALYPTRFRSPDSAASWPAGTRQTLTWDPDTLRYGATVGMELWLGDSLTQNQTFPAQTLPTVSTSAGTLAVDILPGLKTSSRYRIRMRSVSSPGTLGFSSYFSIQGVAADRFEPNDNMESATALQPERDLDSLTLHYNDRDDFRFQTQAATLYVMETKAPASLLTVFWLYEMPSRYNLGTASQNGTADTINTFAWWSKTALDVDLLVLSAISNVKNHGPYSLSVRAYADSACRYKVSGPVEGSTWRSGDTLDIRWTHAARVPGLLDVTLLASNAPVDTLAAAVPAAGMAGSLKWAVPSGLAPRSDYRIRVAHRLNPAIEGLSGVFTIAPP